MNTINTDDVPKYRKKRNNKIVKKSNHKHIYKECLYLTNKGRYYLGTYCEVCNKIGDIKIFLTKPYKKNVMLLSNEEIYEKYKYLDIKNIEDVTSKTIL